MNPEKFILSHASQRLYDPQKAHDYYIRNRQLKGRRPAMAKLSTKNVRKKGKLTGDLAIEDTRDKVDSKGNLLKPTVTITEKRQAQVQERVKALRGKLGILKLILNKLVSEASASSTTKKSKSGATKSRSADSKDRKALTGTQKREKAKKARDQYKKEHPQSEDDKRQQKIEEVKQKIEEVKSQLKQALERARQMSTNKPKAVTKKPQVATKKQPAKKPPNSKKG